jgi:hypothetical protein
MIKMNLYRQFIALVLLAGVALPAAAYKYVPPTGTVGMTTAPDTNIGAEGSRAAACSPAIGKEDLQWNNVKARIETGGNMWQNRADSRGSYIVPKPPADSNDPGISSLYAGGLWMGGKSLDQTLKLAAVTFRANGNDFWPGPLTNDGTAEVTPSTCEAYDKFTICLRRDAENHGLYHDLLAAGASQDEIDASFPNGYTQPAYFSDYPAHGNTAAGQDFYLAPFYDADGSTFYEPENGDYPYYDYRRQIDCRSRERRDVVPLFGDQTFYWIFNDKGNIHTESQGQAIGMEIRAQAFAFNTNDEINNMTFLNYVLINQGSQTLTETFFGSWVDPDLGNANDDYVGCDVQRGLGYCYNGDADDEAQSNSQGYGINPPAVGIDFFEGPYQDDDSIANPLSPDIAVDIALDGIPYKGLGIGYGDTLKRNERFGMRRFVYYNRNENPINGEPSAPQHYYNYLRGIWKNGAEMRYGGNGVSGAGVIQGLPCQYMFPGDSDPYNWSTFGTAPPATSIPWTEETANNLPFDRRFIQSAGPFTLAPGDYNNITLGVVWARAFNGDPYESVELLRLADDKAQSLFDNCFEIVSGPDAPDVVVQELDKEVILMLTNDNPLSNNYKERYLEFDPSIPDSLQDGTLLDTVARSYRFEGYMIYQLLNGDVSNSELSDINKARLIAQCDLQNNVTSIINYNRDQTTGLIVPSQMVDGANVGNQHSFRITNDVFALGNNTLINFKTYYFMAIAYGYNNYAPYDIATSTGQDDVFKASRKGAVGEVKKIIAIPHNVRPEDGGTVIRSSYGDGVFLTRIEGKGNGKNDQIITSQSENEMLGFPYTCERLEYLPSNGPVEIKVVDPLRVPAADFELRLDDPIGDFNDVDMKWKLTNLTDGEEFTTISAFSTLNEDLLLNYGMSISWGQYEYRNKDNVTAEHYADFIDGTIEFADISNPWLGGIPDEDGFTEQNWIRAGAVKSEDNTPEEEKIYDDYQDGSPNLPFTDEEANYEKVLNGTWSPYCLAGYTTILTTGEYKNIAAPTSDALHGDLSPIIGLANVSNIAGLNNIDVVFTSDKTKWTRCPVLEMQSIPDLIEEALPSNIIAPDREKMKMRHHLSIDKNGKTVNDPGCNQEEANLNGEWGMGWFPGYVVDVGTGERLNMAYGEDSWLNGENGRDMIWNPSNRFFGAGRQPLFGGQHWIYVFKNLHVEGADEDPDTDGGLDVDEYYVPRYDGGGFLFDKLSAPGLTGGNLKKIFRACTWVGSSLTLTNLLTPEQGLVPNQARVRLRVAKPYRKFSYTDQPLNSVATSINDWRNLYEFSTKGISPFTNVDGDLSDGQETLNMINIVPNPYYAFSSYESSKLDNRVKIINLPYVCNIKIYDLNGTMIRQFKKSDPTTSLDWDLKNHKNIPIASGVYIIHIDVPNVGEKILKWFGVMRPIDLDSF